jgi:hypothetical protein
MSVKIPCTCQPLRYDLIDFLTDRALSCIGVCKVEEAKTLRFPRVFVGDETELQNTSNRREDVDQLLLGDCEGNVANEDRRAWLRSHRGCGRLY